MRLLVLGGSAFLGRAVVSAAVEAGHEVTTFNRGVTGPDHPGAAAVRGDRTEAADLARVAGLQPWDAVLDTSPQVPAHVLASARACSEVARYVLVTSVSVYPGWPGSAVDAGSPTFDCAPDAGADFGDYGQLKAGCERAAAEVLGPRAVAVRPGVILGPHENVGRLPWWLRRMQRGGRVLAPGRPDAPIQAVDVRDLAALLLALTVPDAAPGPVLAVGPVGRDSYGDWLRSARDVVGGDAELEWVEDDFLVEHGVGEWDELPLWVPAAADSAHAWDVDGSSGWEAGLVCRPLAETVADTWSWLREETGPIGSERIGLDPVKERLVLDAWRER